MERWHTGSFYIFHAFVKPNSMAVTLGGRKWVLEKTSMLASAGRVLLEEEVCAVRVEEKSMTWKGPNERNEKE